MLVVSWSPDHGSGRECARRVVSRGGRCAHVAPRKFLLLCHVTFRAHSGRLLFRPGYECDSLSSHNDSSSFSRNVMSGKEGRKEEGRKEGRKREVGRHGWWAAAAPAGAATGTGVAMLVAQASAPTQVVCLGPEGGTVGFLLPRLLRWEHVAVEHTSPGHCNPHPMAAMRVRSRRHRACVLAVVHDTPRRPARGHRHHISSRSPTLRSRRSASNRAERPALVAL